MLLAAIAMPTMLSVAAVLGNPRNHRIEAAFLYRVRQRLTKHLNCREHCHRNLVVRINDEALASMECSFDRRRGSAESGDPCGSFRNHREQAAFTVGMKIQVRQDCEGD